MNTVRSHRASISKKRSSCLSFILFRFAHISRKNNKNVTYVKKICFTTYAEWSRRKSLIKGMRRMQRRKNSRKHKPQRQQRARPRHSAGPRCFSVLMQVYISESFFRSIPVYEVLTLFHHGCVGIMSPVPLRMFLPYITSSIGHRHLRSKVYMRSSTMPFVLACD